jgi:hypothetical protein
MLVAGVPLDLSGLVSCCMGVTVTQMQITLPLPTTIHCRWDNRVRGQYHMIRILADVPPPLPSARSPCSGPTALPPRGCDPRCSNQVSLGKTDPISLRLTSSSHWAGCNLVCWWRFSPTRESCLRSAPSVKARPRRTARGSKLAAPNTAFRGGILDRVQGGAMAMGSIGYAISVSRYRTGSCVLGPFSGTAPHRVPQHRAAPRTVPEVRRTLIVATYRREHPASSEGRVDR